MSVDRLQEMRKRKRMAAGGGQAVEMQPVIKVCLLFRKIPTQKKIISTMIIPHKITDILPHTRSSHIAFRTGPY